MEACFHHGIKKGNDFSTHDLDILFLANEKKKKSELQNIDS